MSASPPPPTPNPPQANPQPSNPKPWTRLVTVVVIAAVALVAVIATAVALSSLIPNSTPSGTCPVSAPCPNTATESESFNWTRGQFIGSQLWVGGASTESVTVSWQITDLTAVGDLIEGVPPSAHVWFEAIGGGGVNDVWNVTTDGFGQHLTLVHGGPVLVEPNLSSEAVYASANMSVQVVATSD